MQKPVTKPILFQWFALTIGLNSAKAKGVSKGFHNGKFKSWLFNLGILVAVCFGTGFECLFSSTQSGIKRTGIKMASFLNFENWQLGPFVLVPVWALPKPTPPAGRGRYAMWAHSLTLTASAMHQNAVRAACVCKPQHWPSQCFCEQRDASKRMMWHRQSWVSLAFSPKPPNRWWL